jgi:pyruvate carboxylase
MNRGEIAKRIIDCARELSIETFALVTAGDTSHALGAAYVLSLTTSASYLDIPALVGIVKQHRIDAVHPGYGFLSESADFARRMWSEAGAVVIGPGWDILSKTGDKLAAKLLARECTVPTLPAMNKPTMKIEDVRHFAREIGLPIMLKAVDGGGGKGIRLVRQESELKDAMKRAIAESPSHQIFVEKAAVDGFRHIEVQIVGDGSGQVRQYAPEVFSFTQLTCLELVAEQCFETLQWSSCSIRLLTFYIGQSLGTRVQYSETISEDY